ncbi:MAG: hypothetical protein AAF636_17620 [Pseudomonadota bacterium]
MTGFVVGKRDAIVGRDGLVSVTQCQGVRASIADVVAPGCASYATRAPFHGDTIMEGGR